MISNFALSWRNLSFPLYIMKGGLYYWKTIWLPNLPLRLNGSVVSSLATSCTKTKTRSWDLGNEVAIEADFFRHHGTQNSKHHAKNRAYRHERVGILWPLRFKYTSCLSSSSPTLPLYITTATSLRQIKGTPSKQSLNIKVKRGKKIYHTEVAVSENLSKIKGDQPTLEVVLSWAKRQGQRAHVPRKIKGSDRGLKAAPRWMGHKKSLLLCTEEHR